MKTKLKKYCFDTNCFIEPWHNFYSRKSHLSYWDDFILPKIMNGEISILEEVWKEIEKKDDDICAWFREHIIDKDELLIETSPDLVYQVRNLLSKYPKLSDRTKGRSIADPFLVAHAKKENISIVTLEKPSNNIEKPKIPDVCKAEGVRYIDLFQYIDEMNVSFKLDKSKIHP